MFAKITRLIGIGTSAPEPQSPTVLGPDPEAVGVGDTRQPAATMPLQHGPVLTPSSMPMFRQEHVPSAAPAPSTPVPKPAGQVAGRSMKDVQNHYNRKRGSARSKAQVQRNYSSTHQTRSSPAPTRVSSPRPAGLASASIEDQFHDCQTPEDRITQLEQQLKDQLSNARRTEDGLRAELEATKKQATTLQQSLKRVEDEMKRQQAAHKALLDREAAARKRGDELFSNLAETKKQLASTASELATLRAFSAGDDSDTQALLRLFDDINDAVADLAFRLIDSLNLGDRVIRSGDLSSLQSRDPNMYEFAGRFLSQCVTTSCPIEDALVPVAQAIFHHILQDMIFGAFMPIEHDESAIQSRWLLEVLELIRKREPQQHVGRWRSIAYNALKQRRNDRSLSNNIVLAAFGILATLVTAIVPDLRVNATAIFEKQTDSALHVVELTLKWQDRAKGLHYAFDYTTYFPAPGARFVDVEMTPQDLPPVTTARGDSILLAISMGLIASRTSGNEQSNVLPTQKVLKKAHVLR